MSRLAVGLVVGSFTLIAAILGSPAYAACVEGSTTSCAGPGGCAGTKDCVGGRWDVCTCPLSGGQISGTLTNNAGSPFTSPGATITATGGYSSGYDGSFLFASLPDASYWVASSVPLGYSVRYRVDGGPWVIGSSVAVAVSSGVNHTVDWKYDPVTTLVVYGFATPAVAGTAQGITVEARDAFGNCAIGYRGTVSLSSDDGQGVLPATYAFHGCSHTFSNVTLKTAGTRRIWATDTGDGSIWGQQSGILIAPGTASSFSVAGHTSPIVAGTPGSVVVTAVDPYGNVATGYGGLVNFVTMDSQATLPASYQFGAGDAGVHTFTNAVILRTVGTQGVWVGDGVIGGVQGGIVVNAASAASFAVSGIASPTTAGDVRSVTVTAKDPYGNVATGYAGTIAFSSSDPAASLPGAYAFAPGDAGTHTFAGSVVLRTAGPQGVTATGGGMNGSQTGISVSPGPTVGFAVTGIVSPTTAGIARTVSVTAKDAYGNTTPSYTGTVAFSTSDPVGTVPAAYTFTGADAGSHTFVDAVVLRKAEPQSVSATAGALAGSQSQSGIVVNPGQAAKAVVAGFPCGGEPCGQDSVLSDVGGGLQVTMQDVFGNTAKGFTGTLLFTSTDGQAALPPAYTFQAWEGGVHSFAATLRSSGTHQIAATQQGNPSVTGYQGGIVVAPNPATFHPVVTGLPASFAAGTAQSLTVELKDGWGNRFTGYDKTISFSTDLADPLKADLPLAYTFQASDAGARSFPGSVVFWTRGAELGARAVRVSAPPPQGGPAVDGTQWATVTVGETISPQINGLWPANAALITGVPGANAVGVQALYYDASAGVDLASVVLTLDGVPVTAVSKSTTALVGTLSVQAPPATHTLSLTLADRLGNTATQSNTFVVDTATPTIQFTNVAEGAVLRPGAVVRGAFGDDGPVQLVSVNDVVLIADGSSAGEFTYAPSLPDGPLELRARVVDRAGREATAVVHVNGFVASSAPFSCPVP